jgi:hypothetical protein
MHGTRRTKVDRMPMTPAERQRKKRKLDSGGFEHVNSRYSPNVTAALYFQALDARLSEKKAVAASTDKARLRKVWPTFMGNGRSPI